MAASVNKNRTAQQIKDDRNFQKQIEELVKISGRRILVLSLEDNKVAKSGEESLVRLAVERGEDINLNDVEVYMKALGEPTCGECGKGRKCKVHKYGLRYVKYPASVLLPPMKYKIEGPSWDLTVGRNQLTQYMLLEGYGEGGSLSYKEDRPGWWPESIDHTEWFAKFKHPGGAQIKHLALFLRAILQYYGHDAESYHSEVIVEESEPKRKKPQKKWKKNKSKQVVDTTIDDEDDVEEEANRARAARAMETARAGVRDTVNVRNMVEDHDVAEVTDRVEEQYEVRDVEESRETMSGSEAMEAARAGGRDTAEASDMEDVHDTADDHDTAEEERYEVVEVIMGKDKPCYICRAFTDEILFFCRSCYNPYHQLCLQMQHLPQHKGLNGSGSMCGQCLNSKDILDTADDHDTAEVNDRVDRDTMSGSEVEVVMAATTPSRRNLTRRIYSLQPPSPQPHAGCGLDITMPLFYDAFKAPSQREVNKWLAAYKSTSVLALSPQASSKSPSILTLSPQDSSKSTSVLTLSPQSQSSPLLSGSSGGTATDEVEHPCEYLKLQERNILEKQKILKEMEIPASLPKRKPRRKRTKEQASDVVPRKSARLASRLNQDQDQEAAVSSAVGQEAAAAVSPAAVDQEAADSPAGGQEAAVSAAGGQEAAAAESPTAVDQEAAVSAAAEGHKSTKSPAGGQEAGAQCAPRLVADYSSDSGQE